MFIKRLAGGTAIFVSILMGEQLAVAASTTGDGGRGAYLAGKRAATATDRRRQFSAGIAEARARLAAAPDDPAGLLWLAANLGAEALEQGKVVALRVLPEMERLLLHLEAVDPNYDHAAAARTLGRLYHKAPPIISIGSNKKARVYWEKALARAGDFPANQVLAADFFDDDDQDERAYELANRYLSHPVSVAENPEAAEWQEIAQKIVAKNAGRRPGGGR
jgi:hypothetical protein